MPRALVVHVPHASTHIPATVRDQFLLPCGELHREAQLSADLYTDSLARKCWPEAELIEAEVSRIVVDVERYADDAHEAMAVVGRGMIYTRTHKGALLRREISADERRRLQETYKRHWQRLRRASEGKILIDLHSYPATPWPVELMQDAPRPEIDIGATDGVTPRRWTDALIAHFATACYEVSVNTPYAGVIDAGAAAAVMIEIRRDVMGAPGDERWARLVRCLSAVPIDT